MTIGKAEAARRQFETAMDLYFDIADSTVSAYARLCKTEGSFRPLPAP
ncbi:hypothetical protein [Neorhizobium sp. AL 9.2.2]|nr:hypothetical protein [Neorhizobium sp. AL 9.2.2]NSY20211.1 hypothetical protein [Neorhizobium sp. AL 9.2.2]